MKFANIIKYIFTIIILCSLQVSLCKYISVFGITPNIVIPFVISVSVVNGPVAGGIIALICGFFIDSLSSGTKIINSITYMYMAVICGVINLNYLRRNIGVAILFTFISVLVCEEATHFLHFTIWGTSGLLDAILYPVLPTAVYSTILSVPIYYATKKIFADKTGRDYI